MKYRVCESTSTSDRNRFGATPSRSRQIGRVSGKHDTAPKDVSHQVSVERKRLGNNNSRGNKGDITPMMAERLSTAPPGNATDTPAMLKRKVGDPAYNISIIAPTGLPPTPPRNSKSSSLSCSKRSSSNRSSNSSSSSRRSRSNRSPPDPHLSACLPFSCKIVTSALGTIPDIHWRYLR